VVDFTNNWEKIHLWSVTHVDRKSVTEKICAFFGNAAGEISSHFLAKTAHRCSRSLAGAEAPELEVAQSDADLRETS